MKSEQMEIKLSNLVPNDWNTQKMTHREFELLVGNIEEVGFLEPVLVVPIENNQYRIIGGEHRWKAVKELGWDTIPCIVGDPNVLDLPMQKKLSVRMNMIHGSISPERFNELVQEMLDSGEVEIDSAAEEFGIADEDYFFLMIENAKEVLPKEAHKELQERSSGISSVDELSDLVSSLLKKYGDTQEANFMVISFGKQKHLWIRCSEKELDGFIQKARDILELGYTVDSVMRLLWRGLKVDNLQKHAKRLDKVISEQSIEDLLSSNPPGE